MVVFDGYKSEPFNKDFTHYQPQRKSKKALKPIASSGRTIYSAKSNLLGEIYREQNAKLFMQMEMPI